MLYREIIAICSQIHTKRITTLRGQNVEFWIVKLRHGWRRVPKIWKPPHNSRRHAVSSTLWNHRTKSNGDRKCVRPWIFRYTSYKHTLRGSHVRYRHLLCGLNNSSKRHLPVGFVKRSGSAPYGLEFLYQKLCCYGKMSVTCNNEKDLVFWSTVHVKYGYLMTGVMRKKKNKSLSVRARLVSVGQRKSYGGVEIFYVILDPPLFSLHHTPLHFSLFFFLNMCQDSYCEDSCRFSILRRRKLNLS
jgi:hypothetical protein